jgi:hypothetical protein
MKVLVKWEHLYDLQIENIVKTLWIILYKNFKVSPKLGLGFIYNEKLIVMYILIGKIQMNQLIFGRDMS